MCYNIYHRRVIFLQIQKDAWKFSVDIEKTREYYENLSLCDCGECRNYYLQIEEKLPKLKEFLSEFGVDISKPDNLSSCTYEGEIDYFSVYYTVCGEITESSKYEIDIYDNLFLSIIASDDTAPPNEQTGDYFTFSVMQIRLPWILNEPFPDSVASEVQSVFSKFLGFFKKKK